MSLNVKDISINKKSLKYNVKAKPSFFKTKNDAQKYLLLNFLLHKYPEVVAELFTKQQHTPEEADSSNKCYEDKESKSFASFKTLIARSAFAGPVPEPVLPIFSFNSPFESLLK